MEQSGVICLTFDLEEFDLPLEYNLPISEAEQIEISTQGMDALMPILDKNNITCTFFTTGNYAQQKPDLLKQLAQRHEIASHSFFHSGFTAGDLQKTKQVLENICQTNVIGFRMPRMADVNYTDIQAAGYLYDSSLNPTFIPGRYNHLRAPKTIFKKDGLTIFPATVTPTLRIPLFWLTFKNFSITWFCKQVQQCLNTYGYVNLYFHPWEFANTSKFSLPKYMVKNDKEMIEKLIYFVNFFKDKAAFTTVRKQLGL